MNNELNEYISCEYTCEINDIVNYFKLSTKLASELTVKEITSSILIENNLNQEHYEGYLNYKLTT